MCDAAAARLLREDEVVKVNEVWGQTTAGLRR
jgi:hypothetical protein